jgi:benzoylformate decarboxylase
VSAVREVTHDLLLRSFGMTRVFGNPGSTELPILTDFPEDFAYTCSVRTRAF